MKMANSVKQRVMSIIQELEELGGPEAAEYVLTLTAIKFELEKRINTAIESQELYEYNKRWVETSRDEREY